MVTAAGGQSASTTIATTPVTFCAVSLHSRMTLAELSRNWIRYCTVSDPRLHHPRRGVQADLLACHARNELGRAASVLASGRRELSPTGRTMSRSRWRTSGGIRTGPPIYAPWEAHICVSPSSREITRSFVPGGNVEGKFRLHTLHIGRSTRSTALLRRLCHMIATACPSTWVAMLPWLGPPLVNAHPGIRGTPPRSSPTPGSAVNSALDEHWRRARDRHHAHGFGVTDEKLSGVVYCFLLNGSPSHLSGIRFSPRQTGARD